MWEKSKKVVSSEEQNVNNGYRVLIGIFSTEQHIEPSMIEAIEAYNKWLQATDKFIKSRQTRAADKTPAA